MRFPLTTPRDIPLAEAGRRLGLDPADFTAKLPNLVARGFPQPDPDTGLFDTVAMIDGATLVILTFLAPSASWGLATPALSRRRGSRK
jgi:hypothetical protein